VLVLLTLLCTWLAHAGDAEVFQAWVAAPVAMDTSDRTPAGPPPAEAQLTPLERAPQNPEALARVTPGYHFAEELFTPLARWAAERPGRVRVEQFGTSVQGRPLWAVHIAHPGQVVRRKTLVFAGIHAMEWISSEVALRLALDLAEHGPPVGVQVTIIVLLNPDGRAKVERDLARGEEHYRRGNAKNVDLNRDFAVNRAARALWRHLLPGYYRTSPAPLSQPETQALDALAARERYHRAASLHSFGGFFYAPWSGRFGRPARPDREELWELGRAMELAQGTRAYRTRQLGRWGFFFRAHGSEIDHLYGRYGTRAFLIEISRSGIRPMKPQTWRWGFRTYNPEIERRYLKHRDRTVASLRALITHPELPMERRSREAGQPGLPPPIDGDEAP
jgi:carboxypeptidase T